MIGQTISHYQITAKLGAGGMGEVFLAEDSKLDRKVALKFLPASMWNEAEAQQRLIREAKAASQLDHPNIVTIYGIEESEGRLFIVMAHVRGVTLNEYCTSAHRTTDDLIDLAIQIADGLQHAHEAGVIHRDLKPGNILVDDRGRVRILDFGIARLRGTSRLTQVGSTVGTLAYSPPELAQGKDAQPTSDIYSLGVVMYQMLTGRLPFDADHEAALLYSILHEPPVPLAGSDTEIPAKLQNLVLRCLEKQPQRRFPSCTELIKELDRCRTKHVSESSSNAPAVKPSIAVLPFTNMSADPENEYFSDGLSEELLNALAKNPGLKVTGRTSSFAFKGKNEDLRDIGQKLGVDTLLEGSVRKAGNRVRITTQLVKAADGFHLWSETYDRVLDDIFAVQDDIAQSVAAAMNVTLLGRPKPKARGNAESFNLVLQGNHFALRITRESLEKAKSLYQRAIDADPSDARAWAGLAKVILTQSGYGFEDLPTVIRAAKEAGEKALALDDTLPEALELMGWIYMANEFEWKKAGESFRRAYALAPGNGDMLAGLASYEACIGNVEEAMRLAERSVELDPLSPSAFLYGAKAYASARRYEKALEFYGRALELSPDMVSAHASSSFILVLMGRFDEALAQAKKEAPSGYLHFASAIAYHALGRKQESEEALRRLLHEGEQWGFQIACAYAFRGEADQAFEWLDRSYVTHDSGISLAQRHPLLSNLHSDPRWPRFLQNIGLAD